jgi:hypothetical protein
MLDGGTLGTVMIGLESVRAASEWTEPRPRPASRRSNPATAATRHWLAAALRLLADRLDRGAAASHAPRPGATA